MLKLAEGFDTWKPASEVLKPVTAVKTIFVQYNRATRVGGHPLERFSIIHGPSSHGKTTFVNGIGYSFLKANHVYGLIDAEYTTPITWLRTMMGEVADDAGFLAMRPDNYEQTVDAVEQLLARLVALRESEDLPEQTSAFIAVDSLKKLIPKDIWDKIKKLDAESDKGSMDGMGGRLGMIQAAMNTAWMNRLTPLLNKTRTSMMAIARESEKPGADKWDDQFKVQGGQAVNYDSSMTLRVLLAGYVREGKEGPILGERHRVIIRKTKVARKEDKGAVCYFHMSNGVLIPEGFDRARDVLELAKEYKVVAQKGSWLTWRNCRWQGDTVAVKKLTAAPEALDKLQADVESNFKANEELPSETPEDNLEIRG